MPATGWVWGGEEPAVFQRTELARVVSPPWDHVIGYLGWAQA